MSPRITHSKVSGKPNPTDASKVGGEDWDADHVIDGLTIGTDVQAHDTTLDALAGLTTAANKLPYFTNVDVAAVTDLSAFGRSLIDDADAATARATLGLASVPREVLTANRTYYVRTDGSDSNNGLANTSGGAFLTIQKAINVAAALDLSIYDVTIQVGAGTYSSVGNELKSIVGAGKIIIVGDETTPSNVTVTQTGSPTNSQGCFYGNAASGVYSVRGVKLTSATSPGYGFNAIGGTRIEFQNIDFGSITTAQIRIVDGSTCEATGNYKISGGSGNHATVTQSMLRCTGRTITLTGTPAFSGAFCQAAFAGVYNASGNTFSGSATGPRYNALLNGVIQTSGGGASYFPGDSAGSTATGGQYA